MDKVIIKSFQVNAGDCFLISYNKINVLIDTGYIATSGSLIKELDELSKNGESIDILIITHTDQDHINGAVPILDKDIIKIKNVWYNGYMQIFNIHNELEEADEKLKIKLKHIIEETRKPSTDNEHEVGYEEAKTFEESLHDKGLLINEVFHKTRIIAGMEYSYKDVEIHFLNPTDKILDELQDDWKDKLACTNYYDEKRNLVGMAKAFEFYYKGYEAIEDDKESYTLSKEKHDLDVKKLAKSYTKFDTDINNRTSISVLLRINEMNFLFLGDSNPNDIFIEWKKLIKKDTKYKNIKLMKVSHHGSRGNINEKLINCGDIEEFLISTNGSPYREGEGTKPHLESIARIILNKPYARLWYNYPQNTYNTSLSELLKIWNSQEENNIQVSYGERNKPLEIIY